MAQGPGAGRQADVEEQGAILALPLMAESLQEWGIQAAGQGPPQPFGHAGVLEGPKQGQPAWLVRGQGQKGLQPYRSAGGGQGRQGLLQGQQQSRQAKVRRQVQQEFSAPPIHPAGQGDEQIQLGGQAARGQASQPGAEVAGAASQLLEQLPALQATLGRQGRRVRRFRSQAEHGQPPGSWIHPGSCGDLAAL